MHNRTALLISIVGTVLFAFGCGKKDEKGGDESSGGDSGRVHECEISVAAKSKEEPATFKGEATGEDEKAVEEAAWKDVCAKLPEADQPDCKNNDKWKYGMGGASTTVDGKKTFTKTVTLTKVIKIEEFEGKATSPDSRDKACTEAMAKACKAAGAEGDCVAAGTHEERGRSASTKMGQ